MITAESVKSPVNQLYADLREVQKNVRWLKRACAAVMVVTFSGALLLWAVRHPQSFGF